MRTTHSLFFRYRLMEVCQSFVEHIGEEAIYEAYRRRPQSKENLESFLCYGDGVAGSCRTEGTPKKEL